MRLLFLTDSYRPSRSACANRATVLVEALRAVGIDVEVLASGDSLIDASSNYAQPDYVSYFKVFPLEEKTLINRLKNNLGGCTASIKAAKTLGEFDLVLCTTPPLLLAAAATTIAKRKNAKLILDVRDIWPDVAYEMGSFTPSSAYGRFFACIANKVYQKASLVTTVSPGKFKKLSEHISCNDKVALVPNGIDEAFLDNEIDRELVSEYHLTEGTICSYIGNIGLAQGLDTLLDIAAKRPSVRFLIFGKGAERDCLAQKAIDKELSNVIFCGTVDAQGVYTVLRHSQIAYVPLVNSNLKDSIPTKLYECLACGCPVLLTAVGDSADLLDKSGLGRHVAPENVEGIMKAFDEMISKDYSSAQRGAARDFIINEHSRQKHAREFARLVVSRFGESR